MWWAVFWFLGRGCPIRKGATLARFLHQVSATGASAKHSQHADPCRPFRCVERLTRKCASRPDGCLIHPAKRLRELEFLLAVSAGYVLTPFNDFHVPNPWHAVAHSFLTAHDGSLQLCDIAGLDRAVGARSNVGCPVMEEWSCAEAG
jgi:hypothetical protein